MTPSSSLLWTAIRGETECLPCPVRVMRAGARRPTADRGQLHLEPARQLPFLRPDLLHLRAGVAGDHRQRSKRRPGGTGSGERKGRHRMELGVCLRLSKQESKPKELGEDRSDVHRNARDLVRDAQDEVVELARDLVG